MTKQVSSFFLFLVITIIRLYQGYKLDIHMNCS